jgi:hypothetical protein
MTPQELLNANGIYLASYDLGEHALICPRCSANRKPHHQKLKCLSVKIDDQGATWHCNHCGLSGPQKGTGKSNGQGGEFAATYDYPDAAGVLRFQKVRNSPGSKNRFFIRRPNGHGGWINDAKGVDTNLLYRIDEVKEAIAQGYRIAVVEGEKDANNLWAIGIPATCNAHGASEPGKRPKWTKAHSEQLRGADIVVLSDNDPAGYAHADPTCRLSYGVAKRVRRLDLAKHWPGCPEGGDVSDWLGVGHAREQLDALIEQAPDWTPQPTSDGKDEPPSNSVNDGVAFGYSWHLTWHGEASSTGVRKWLVQDLLPETGVALISGQWGTYKTFIADDLCAAVMTGTLFINRQVMRKGGVLFLACEGQDEVDIRLTAAFRKHGGVGNAPFAWVQGCPRLLDPNAGKILAAMVKHAAAKMMQDFGLPIAMVVIDTAGKAAGLSKTGELNDDAVAKTIMKTLADASTETGALFVGVAHFGKNVETGTKGSTGFEDDADVVLALLGERGLNGIVEDPVLCVRKRRSGRNGEEFPFQPEEANIGPDEKGTVEKTLTIRWTDAADAKAAPLKKKSNPWAVKSLRHLHKVMMNMLADCGSEQRPYPDGPIVRAVDIELVKVEFFKSYPATGDEAAKKETRKKAFKRAIDNASGKQLIGTRDIGATTFTWFAKE